MIAAQWPGGILGECQDGLKFLQIAAGFGDVDDVKLALARGADLICAVGGLDGFAVTAAVARDCYLSALVLLSTVQVRGIAIESFCRMWLEMPMRPSS